MVQRVNRDGSPFIPLDTTPGGPRAPGGPTGTPPSDYKYPVHPLGSTVVNLYGGQSRSVPFDMIPQYEVDWDYLKEWVLDHAPALAGSAFVGCGIALTLDDPEKMAPVVNAFGSVIQGILTGTGEIIKGVGEIIPG